jgi:hypothetical protein
VSQYYAGKVDITTLIISNSNQYIDARDKVVGFSIFEDIYSPFVYIELAIIDYDSFAKKFPLLGEEYLTVIFKTENSKEINYTFLLYKNDSTVIQKMNYAQTSILRGITIDKAFDSTKKINESFTGSYTDIAEAIFNTYISSSVGNKKLYGEPARGISKLVFPQLTPLESILMCRRKAVSLSGVFSPYVFFQNSDGYYFVSINTLFDKGISLKDPFVHVLTTNNLNPLIDTEFSISGSKFKTDVISFSMASNYDSVIKIDFGAYNSSTFNFDLTTKQFVLKNEYNLSRRYDKFQLGTTGEFNSSKFLSSFNDRGVKYFNTLTDVSLQLEGTQYDFYPDAASEMKSYSLQVSESSAKILMYGDSNFAAGQVAFFQTYLTDIDSSKRKIDPQKTGHYLMTAVRHDITLDGSSNYKMSISAIKGTNNDSVEEMSSE